MKKVALLLLIVVYAMSSFGIGVRQFYCCGELTSTDISFSQLGSKDKCGMEAEMPGCCNSSFKSFKVKDSHVAADAIDTPVKQITGVLQPSPGFDESITTDSPANLVHASHAPPINYGVAMYIWHCSFRI
jgi:hypothetical protein